MESKIPLVKLTFPSIKEEPSRPIFRTGSTSMIIYESDRKYKKHYTLSRRKADQEALKEARRKIAAAILIEESRHEESNG
jgi:2'-5' RNA ligase